MKKYILAPFALLLLGASEAETVSGDMLCAVRYDRVTHFTYMQPIAGKALPGMTIRGRYGDTAPPFEFLDDDGFLSLMMVLADWGANGTAAQNLKGDVGVERRDLLMLRDSAAVGRGFFNRIIAYAAARSDLKPGQILEVEDAKQYLAMWDKIDLQIGNSLSRASGSTAMLPPGFIAMIGDQMERLRPDAARRIASKYEDEAAGGLVSQLCTAEARNPLIGRILCDRDFRTGVERDKPFCRPGSTIGSPATALNCDAVIENGKLSPTRCTNGTGGPAASVPRS